MDDEDNTPEDCPECGGWGNITRYVGTYGTSDCRGETEDECEDCNGTGVI